MRIVALGLAGVALWVGAALGAEAPLRVGSKAFTESVILGELIRVVAEPAGEGAVVHRSSLGGTRILWNALLNGDIDLYPEYTGTLRQELLAKEPVSTDRELREELARRGIGMTASLGFNNTYAIGMTRAQAAKLGIRKISDLARHPELRMGFTNEFMQRQDGWPALRRAYGLTPQSVRGLDHDLAYRALKNGDIQAVDLYATDAEIRDYDLVPLEDDLGVFPRYDAVILYRRDRMTRYPAALAAIQRLEGAISAPQMTAMNALAKFHRIPEGEVARRFAHARAGTRGADHPQESLVARVSQRLGEHLEMVLVSLLAACAVAIPLGIMAAKYPGLGKVMISVVGIIQTIPALALLVMLMGPLKAVGLPGIGEGPAIVALFLYSLLPVVRNTHAGLLGIAPGLRDSAEALGLKPWDKLRLIELPLASSYILVGIKTAAVTNVGFATLGALVGAGGLGQPILAGIRLDDYALILEGAVPAALLALATQAGFAGLERLLVPRGIRL